MNAHTYFKWIMGLTGTDNKPVFDPSKKITDQAVYGYPIKIDNQISDNIIYFGDGSRVHLNYGSQPQLNAWEDYDTNTHKIGVRCVAGAAVETGAFVKMYVAAA